MSKKSRFFSIMTYCNEKQIQKVMSAHISSLRGFCYIYHDVDEAEPHHHVLLRTHSTWTETQIKKWFDLQKDKEGKYINTFIEIANDPQALELYLTHSDKESIEKGKHQYPKEAIKDFGLCEIIEKKDSFDNSYEILNRILLGANPRDLVRFYGRDFLYHISAYYECVDKIRDMEGYKESLVRTRQAFFQPRLNDATPEEVNDL